MAQARPRHKMPAFVREALEARGLEGAYRARPEYQRNDYLGWIAAAKGDATRQKRLARMLDELEEGGVYMNMPHRPSERAGEARPG